MKFFVSFLLMMILSFAACLYFPWWSIAIVTFIVAAFIPQGPGRSYLTGFLALNTLWSSLALYLSFQNEHVFAHRISLLIIKMDNIPLIIVVTGMIGGLVGGFAAMSGSYMRKLLFPKHKKVGKLEAV